MSAPPYMKLYWGDYHRDTHHLSRSEHGAYLLLLSALWGAGGKLPDDDAVLARYALCTPAEWAEMRPVIMSFFKVSRGKITHKRIAAELAKYDDTIRKRKAAGKAGSDVTNGKRKGIGAANAERLPTKPEPEPELEEEPPNPPEGGDPDLFGLQPDEKPKVDDVEVAFNAWNDLARRRGLPVAKTLDDARRRAIRKRLEDGGLDGWREALDGVNRSAFLLGQRAGSDGRTMKADLGFVCQAKSYPRLREGFYGKDAAAPVTAMPALAWGGPPDLLADLRHQMGPGRADDFLRRSRWDPERQAIVTASPTVAAMIRRDADQVIRAHHTKVIEEIAA